MTIYNAGYNLLSPVYLQNIEQIHKNWVLSEYPIVEATLQGKPIYIVADMALAKSIFEDAKNFSFAPIGLTSDQGLTDGAKAFVEKGFESQLVSASFDDYRELRKVLNNAFKKCYADRAEFVDRWAKRHLEEILSGIPSTTIDGLALCRQYWLPLAADMIGVGSLPLSDLTQLARQARALNEGYGLLGDRETLDSLAGAKETVTGFIRTVVRQRAAPEHSVIQYFLSEVDTETAIDLACTFILGSIDTGSGVLALQTHLLGRVNTILL